MKATVFVIVAILGTASPTAKRPRPERCQIVDAVMDGRTSEDLRQGKKPYKSQACIAGAAARGRFRVSAFEVTGNLGRQSLVGEGEECLAQYVGIPKKLKPGIVSFVEIEVRPGGEPEELTYSAGLRIEQVEEDGTINQIGMGCGGYEEGTIRRVSGRWIPVNSATQHPKKGSDN